MALSNKKLIGYWKVLPGTPFHARTFDNGVTWDLCQVVSEYPDSFIVRGKQLALDADAFTLASGITTDDVNLFRAAPDEAGLQQPAAFVMPAGYVKKFASDGTAYYENSAERIAFEKGDKDGDGAPDSRSANLLTQVTDWVKANWVIVVAGVVVVYLVLKANSGGKGKKKGLLAGLL